MSYQKKIAVTADIMLVDDAEVAKDVTFELPAIALQTADVAAMGTMSIPLIGLLDDMALSITKIGTDRGFSRMSKLKNMKIEFRWVQDQISTSGAVSHKGCKAFLNVIPQEIPGPSIEIGSSVELDMTYTATRYQLFTDGKELMLVDRLNQILRIDGKDYMEDIKNLL